MPGADRKRKKTRSADVLTPERVAAGEPRVMQPVMHSAGMRRIDRILRTIAAKDVIVTLVGESGTGKEVLARRIHELSNRRSAPFIPINCAAIPELLFESELFGHERGAFTGASERAKGKVEAAQGGTLFLDEVGELPTPMQAKLLRFLEHRRFMRVGGSTKIQADVRLLFATLRPLEEEVRAGRFRADLYYRIQGITLRIPTLRDRRADLSPLIGEFVTQLSSRHGTEPPQITRATRSFLLAYDWPGNVRELKNAIEVLCLLRAGKRARVRDLPEPLQHQTANAPISGSSIAVDLGEPLQRSVERIVEAALALEGGNRSLAAERLGISVRTVQRYLARGVASGGETKRRRG